MIGITVVVAGDSYFVTLFVVIIFHQMFEGIALGSRIAAVGHRITRGGAGGSASHNPYAFPPMPPKAEDSPVPTDTNIAAADGSVSSGTATSAATTTNTTVSWKTLSMPKKLLMALAFAVTTPIGMAIGIGVLHTFNGNDPTTLWAIGTLDALSAGILIWVGVVEMWAGDWMFGGEMAEASPLVASLALVGLLAGMVLMSFLGKWA